MKIRIPNSLYQVFPLLSIFAGFWMVALIHHPFAIVSAAGLYVYAFRVLWLRTRS